MNAKRSKTKHPSVENEREPQDDKAPSLKDMPFEVDPFDDGDMAPPKPDFDEQDIKEQEERR